MVKQSDGVIWIYPLMTPVAIATIQKFKILHYSHWTIQSGTAQPPWKITASRLHLSPISGPGYPTVSFKFLPCCDNIAPKPFLPFFSVNSYRPYTALQPVNVFCSDDYHLQCGNYWETARSSQCMTDTSAYREIMLHVSQRVFTWYDTGWCALWFTRVTLIIPLQTDTYSHAYICCLSSHDRSTFVKLKFHYADFATKSGISSWQNWERVTDTNHESPRHKSRRRLSWFVSATKSVDFVANFVANISTCWEGLCLRLSWFVSVTFTETSWFHDLSPFVSATFMICVHDFRRGEVSVKVGVMEFGLYTAITKDPH